MQETVLREQRKIGATNSAVDTAGTMESKAPSVTGRRRMLIAAVGLAVFIVAWLVVNLAVDGAGFATSVSPKLRGGEEAASAVARLFAALVLGMFLADREGHRMRWVAGGLVVLGFGHLVFGYIEPMIQNDPIEVNEALYEGFVAQTLACALFAVGLFPRRPPPLLVRAATIIPTALVLGYVVVFEFLGGDDWMPRLVRDDVSLKETLNFDSPLEWLYPLHWTLAALPLGLALAAVVGAFWQSRRGLLRGWLLFAMVLLAGSQLHEYLWPSPYGGRILTTADVLSLAFAVVVAIGGITELRRVASERAALLASERERTRRLSELAALKADFSAMVAHELDGPIGAMRRLTELLSAEGADQKIRDYATSTMEVEIDALNALVRDVRTSAGVERDDFKVEPLSLPIGALLADAEAYGKTLAGDHPIHVNFIGILTARQRVLADPERIGQVLRNLLSNAAKYSPEGSPIELRAMAKSGSIRIEVADHGPGIHPDDLRRIFEKFGRGRDGQGKKVSGVGLGLYLSRRIVQSHGSELRVRSKLGEGSVFGFELEIVR